MQLDRTEIVIKQRTGLELLDLSLLLLKLHFKQVVATFALLGLPLLILDTLAISWMLGEDAYLAAENLTMPREAMWLRHTSHLVILFSLQFQLISLPTTVFLGNVIFFESMTIPKLLRRLVPVVGRSLFVLGFLRLGLVNLVLVWFVSASTTFSGLEFWMLVVIGTAALLLRAAWPFAPEILGLEFCALRKGRGSELSYWQRSRGLHNSLSSENFSRFLAAAFFSVLLVLMMVGLALFFQGIVTGDWQWNGWFDHLILPACMWLVGLFMAVFRFLSYLDSRIRLEGWEIELQMRAEANRLSYSSKPVVSVASLATETVPT